MSGDPNQANYYGFNFYHVQTDFEYIGVHSELGHGWKLDDKAYTYRYWNKQNYNGSTITATSATDKLNGYRKVGDILSVSHETTRGVLRTGIWYEWAYTDRYQIPSNPRTWVDTVLPNFHEHFITTSLQPFVEYEYRVTPLLSVTAGVKLSDYIMDLKQFADNGKTVGSLNGAPYVTHSANYHSWLPAIDARYKLPLVQPQIHLARRPIVNQFDRTNVLRLAVIREKDQPAAGRARSPSGNAARCTFCCAALSTSIGRGRLGAGNCSCPPSPRY